MCLTELVISITLTVILIVCERVFKFAPYKIFISKASELKNGNIIRLNGELLQVEEFLHRTPGNLRAFYQARMRNVKGGKLVEYRIRIDEDVSIARVKTNDYQYLYAGGDVLVIMDNATFNQHTVPKKLFGITLKFLN